MTPTVKEPERDPEPDRDRSPVAAASHARKAMDFPIPIAVGTCCGQGPSLVAAASQARKAMDFPMPIEMGTCCGRGPSAVRFQQKRKTISLRGKCRDAETGRVRLETPWLMSFSLRRHKHR